MHTHKISEVASLQGEPVCCQLYEPLQRFIYSLLSNFKGKMMLFINYVNSIKSNTAFRTLKINIFSLIRNISDLHHVR